MDLGVSKLKQSTSSSTSTAVIPDEVRNLQSIVDTLYEVESKSEILQLIRKDPNFAAALEGLTDDQCVDALTRTLISNKIPCISGSMEGLLDRILNPKHEQSTSPKPKPIFTDESVPYQSKISDEEVQRIVDEITTFAEETAKVASKHPFLDESVSDSSVPLFDRTEGGDKGPIEMRDIRKEHTESGVKFMTEAEVLVPQMDKIQEQIVEDDESISDISDLDRFEVSRRINIIVFDAWRQCFKAATANTSFQFLDNPDRVLNDFGIGVVPVEEGYDDFTDAEGWKEHQLVPVLFKDDKILSAIEIMTDHRLHDGSLAFYIFCGNPDQFATH